jgi:nucleoside-diphosphate-sugar epimerase
VVKKVLVTGGAGFIGSHIVRELLVAGHEVQILDNFSSGRLSNLKDIESDVEIHKVDLRDGPAVAKAIQGRDWVFHQAARPSVPRSIEEPRESHDVNINGSLNVLLGAKEGDLEAVVMASSSSVYGNSKSSPKHEDLLPAPLSPYALQKLTMEHMGKVFSSCYDMRVVSLRYFNVFGPRQDPSSAYAAVVPNFVTAYLAKTAPTIYGDGEQTRDFTFVGNVVAANIAAAQRGRGGLVANIAGGVATSVNELARKISEILGLSELKPQYLGVRAGDVKHSLAAVERARAEMGFENLVSFEEGLRLTIDWYREKGVNL